MGTKSLMKEILQPMDLVFNIEPSWNVQSENKI